MWGGNSLFIYTNRNEADQTEKLPTLLIIATAKIEETTCYKICEAHSLFAFFCFFNHYVTDKIQC